MGKKGEMKDCAVREVGEWIREPLGGEIGRGVKRGMVRGGVIQICVDKELVRG